MRSILHNYLINIGYSFKRKSLSYKFKFENQKIEISFLHAPFNSMIIYLYHNNFEWTGKLAISNIEKTLTLSNLSKQELQLLEKFPFALYINDLLITRETNRGKGYATLLMRLFINIFGKDALICGYPNENSEKINNKFNFQYIESNVDKKQLHWRIPN